ncbi:MAG: dihydropyrimidinase [Actinobacteria bacterium]|jgi:dihydropyrimidinase|nr:dihydropyrimidinase [Actinomycetota bacterium]
MSNGRLIRGGTVVDSTGMHKTDVRVGEDGTVREVAPGLVAMSGEEVYDATSKLVIPGGVDAHTHLHLEVGDLRTSDDFASGTMAAVMGGTTCVIEYVTPRQGEDPLAAVEYWRSLGESACIDWSLHATFTSAVSSSVVASLVEGGITSFKLYLAYSQLAISDREAVQMLFAAKEHGAVVCFHCENGGAIDVLIARALAEGRKGVPEHASTRPAILEAEAVNRVCSFAEITEATVYLVHLSSALALENMMRAKDRGVHVLGETCPHYLWLDRRKLEGEEGICFMCSPPLRDKSDQDQLWNALASGMLDTVATDHCPFWTADRKAGIFGKSHPADNFSEMPGGLPGIETRMALMWQGVRAGLITPMDWVRTCCEQPAKIFGLWPKKGSLAVGADADLVVWDPNRPASLDYQSLHMATDHSPYQGWRVEGWPELVLSRGRVVVHRGRFMGERGVGQFVPGRVKRVNPEGF